MGVEHRQRGPVVCGANELATERGALRWIFEQFGVRLKLIEKYRRRLNRPQEEGWCVVEENRGISRLR